LRAKIFEFSAPRLPGAFLRNIELVPNGVIDGMLAYYLSLAELLSRHIVGSSPISLVNCRFPIAIVGCLSKKAIGKHRANRLRSLCLTRLGHNEHSELRVALHNVSRTAYGVSEDTKIGIPDFQ
jgi:hypothetical protein